MKCEWLSLCGGWELTTAIGQLGISSVCHVHLFLPIYIRIPEGDSLKEVVRQFQSNYNLSVGFSTGVFMRKVGFSDSSV